MARSRPIGSSTETLTLTVNQEESSLPPPSSSSNNNQTLILRLKRAMKKVTWKEGTVDNEFLNRKSSKKCCIYHKEKPFDEDDSDDGDDDFGRSAEDLKEKNIVAGSSRCCSHRSN